MSRYLLNIAFVLALALALPAMKADQIDMLSEQPLGTMGDEIGSGSYLGVDTRDVTSDRVSELKLKEERGVEITMVDQDAPAGKAGLRERDVILNFNGEPVESVEQLRRMIRETPAGRGVNLGISREGQPLNIKVQLERRKTFVAHGGTAFSFSDMPNFAAIPAIPEIDVPSIVVVTSSKSGGGLLVENLTPQLGDYFGVRNGRGVLVRSVDKGSAAERAGFRAGDVIVRVEHEPVADTGDWQRSIRGHSGTVNIGIMRDRKLQTLSLVRPKRTGKANALQFEPYEIRASIDPRPLQEEIERMRPKIERARQQAQKEIVRQTAAIQCDIARQVRQSTMEARRQIQLHRREIEEAQRAAQQATHEFQLHQHEIEKAIQDSVRELGRSLDEI